MKALVLAAGFGTRLRPWTEKLPKPLIPVAGVEPLFFALSKLNDLGASEVFVNGHYLAEKIDLARMAFGKNFPKMKIHFSWEEKILGTGGGILKLINDGNQFPQGLLVMNGDTLANIDLDKLPRDQCSMAVSFKSEFLMRYQPLWLDENLHWVSSSKSPPNAGLKGAHFLGVHFLSPGGIQLLASLKLPTLEIDLFEGIYKHLQASKVKIKAVELLTTDDEFWIDLNKKEFFEEAKELVLKKFPKVWNDILKNRHPGVPLVEAQAFWPL